MIRKARHTSKSRQRKNTVIACLHKSFCCFGVTDRHICCKSAWTCLSRLSLHSHQHALERSARCCDLWLLACEWYPQCKKESPFFIVWALLHLCQRKPPIWVDDSGRTISTRLEYKCTIEFLWWDELIAGSLVSSAKYLPSCITAISCVLWWNRVGLISVITSFVCVITIVLSGAR